ncbi:MAG: hypothetical protein ABIR70_22870 [Bryobacteraceae bacterium]
MANDLVTSVRTLQGSLDLAANMMASIDCYSFDEHDRDIVRSRYLLREIAPRSKRQTVRQLPSRIESLVGFQIEEYCDLAFGACMKNMAADVGDIAYITPALKADNFQPTSIDPLRAELFLRTISATEDEFFQELSQKATHELDLTVFRNRPLLRMADTYAVLDVGLALDKAGRSLFWTALKSAEAAKERMGMLGNWGYLFEDYTNEILNGVGHPSRAVIANPCFHDGT